MALRRAGRSSGRGARRRRRRGRVANRAAATRRNGRASRPAFCCVRARNGSSRTGARGIRRRACGIIGGHGRSVLVTGGAGYVGSHVVVELAQAGYAPVVLDDYSNSSPAVRTRLEALAGRPVPCINADVRDVVALRAASTITRSPPCHCAGRGRQRVGRTPARVLRRQRRRDACALEVMGEPASRRSSTRPPRRLRPAVVRRVDEEAPLAAASVYGRNVRVVEDFLRDLRATSTGGLQSCARSTPPARRVGHARRLAARTAQRSRHRAARAAAGEGGEVPRRTATTGPPRTAPPCATTCMSRTSRACTSPR